VNSGWVLIALMAATPSVAAPKFQDIPEDAASMLPEETSLPQEISAPGVNQEKGTVIQGTVRILRGSPQTEVFFVDRKESLIIPNTRQHNEIFQACLRSSQTKTPVSLRIDPKSRTILSVPNSKSGPVESRSLPDSQSESSSGSN